MRKRLTTIIIVFLLVTATGTKGFICDGDDGNSTSPPVQPDQKPYLAGEVRSSMAFKYGRFVARMKPMRRSGVISSFFSFDRPTTNEEIDIEFVGSDRRQAEFNYHHPSENRSLGPHRHPYTLSFDSDADFHIYSFEWTKSYLAWFVDGTEAHRVLKGPNDPLDELVNAEGMMMNIWTSKSTGWSGTLSPSDLPASAVYDWVRHYAWDETSGFQSAPNWQDDFDSRSNWLVSEDTFDDNNAEFVGNNVSIGNGYLTLYLTQRGSAPPPSDTPPCEQVSPFYSLGTTLYGKQAHGSEGDFSCYSDVFEEHGIRISPGGGSGRAIYRFGPISQSTVNISFQWVDNAWFSDYKSLDIFNWRIGTWETVASWSGNDAKIHNDTYQITIYSDREGPEDQIRVALYGAPNSVIHLNTIKAY